MTINYQFGDVDAH
ncbi:ESAT-6 like protein EsxL, partial [Mycobacterium tuberculosis TB_RSA131]